jgi:hypothetical protein
MAKAETAPIKTEQTTSGPAGGGMADAKQTEPSKLTEVPKLHQLMPARFKQADQVRNLWRATMESGRDYKSVFEPTFFAHNAKFLKAGDVIELINDEQTYFARLYVRDAGNNWARVVEIDYKQLDDVEEVATVDGFHIEFKGPHLKFCVYRQRDKAQLSTGHASRVDAQTWALQNRQQAA